MNPQRMVAALAALAIGFGVTLVGVNIIDDETDTIATVDSADRAPSAGEGGAALDDEAEPDATVAESSSVAEAVDDSDAPLVTSSGETSPRDVGDGTGIDSENGSDCEDILVVRTGGGQLLLLGSELGEFIESGGSFFLAGSGESIGEVFQAREIGQISGVIDDRFGGRSVEDCDTGQLLEATVIIDVDGSVTEIDGATPGDVDAEPDERLANDVFPCSSEALDGLLDELDGLEETELISDADIFIRVLAKSLAQFGGASLSEWEADLELRFDEFVPADACRDEFDEVFADDGGIGFFCASANLSADARLFEYLDEVVTDQMTRCSYVHEEGVN